MVPFLLPLAIVVFVAIAIALTMFLLGYQVARPGMALIVTRPSSEPRVLFDGGVLCLPRHAQLLDLSPRAVKLTLAGETALRFAEGAADVTLTIRLRPNPTAPDIMAIASSIGAAVANDPEQLARHLEPQLRAVAMRCVAGRTVASVSDGSLAGALRGELAAVLEHFAVEHCELERAV
jgi:uncharacterized membrane protein YqiK